MIENQRLHGMDALRGIAMWLGVVLHSSISYRTNHTRGSWPMDGDSSALMDLIYMYLHSFRMQMFFLVAGFFAHFLAQRIGLRKFIKHRFKRIVLPLLVSLVTIIPLTSSGFQFDPSGDSSMIDLFFNSIKWTGFYHLWFLYYLILFYVLFIIASSLSVGLKLQSIPELVVFLSIPVLWAIHHFYFDGPVEAWTGIKPQLGQILYYGFFFMLGVIIYSQPSFLFRYKRLRYTYLLLGFALFGLEAFQRFHNINLVGESILLSSTTVFFVFGHVSLFMHFFKKESKNLRYFSDSSYWYYLIHLPLVVWMQLQLMNFAINIWLKFSLIILITTTISLISYRYFVRYTFIGILLNGRKKKKVSE